MLQRRKNVTTISALVSINVWIVISSLLLSSLSCSRGTHHHNNNIMGVDARPQTPLAFATRSSNNNNRLSLTASKFTPRHFSTNSLLLPSSTKTTLRNKPKRTTSASTGLNMFMGSDGGILGIGTPEVLTILLVGYFVLGPSDLYKLTKEIGKFVQNIRTLGSDLTKTVENNLESQLQLDDLRKAQRELNDAFSFRRSINSDVDDDNDEGFGLRAVEKDEEGNLVTASAADTTATSSSSSSSTTPAPTKKIRKRRMKKVVPVEDMEEYVAMPNGGEIPDWEAPFVGQGEPESEWTPTVSSSASSSSITTGMEDWSPSDYTGIDSAEQRKFQAQMNVDAWNAQVMAQAQQQQTSSQEQQQQWGTSPAYQSFVLTKIMERLALLEEEKNAADALLQEEFRLRADTEEKYYREKRQILEEAVVELEEEGSKLKQTATASAGTGSSNTIV